MRAPPDRGLRALLADRDVRLLFMAQFAAQCADGMAQAAFIDTVILEPGAQGTAGRILAVFALTLLPYSVIAPFLGVFVDRWDRRGLLVWTNLIRGVVLIGVLGATRLASGDAALYVGVLLLLGFGRLFLTTKAAVLPVLLHEHHLLQGNAFSGAGGMIAALLGGALGLGAVGLTSAEGVIAIAGGVYVCAAVPARLISHPLSAGSGPSSGALEAVARVTRDLVDGVRAIWRRVPARLALTGIFILRSAVMLTAIAAILVIKKEFPAAGDRFGRLSAGALALGTSSLGAFVGALTAAPMGRRLGHAGLILLGFVVSGIGIVALGGVVDIRAVLALTAIGGFGAYSAKIATDAQIQTALPDRFRGRAFALYDILYNCASVAAAATMLAFQQLSFRALLVPAGFVTLGLAAALGAAMRRARLI